MTYGEIGGIDKKISRLVMGMDNQTTISHATAMFDDFFSRGGTCFDSAHIYGGGRQEMLDVNLTTQELSWLNLEVQDLG